MPIAEGGTNATTLATTDGTVYFDGTRLVTTATGSARQVLTSNGAGVAPSYQASTGGSGLTAWGVQIHMPNSPASGYYSLFNYEVSTVLTDNQWVTPVAATINNLFVNVAWNDAKATTSVVTLNVNGVDKALTLSIPALGTGLYSDLVHTVAINQGDFISIHLNTEFNKAFYCFVAIRAS